jgi:hypothetical protein
MIYKKILIVSDKFHEFANRDNVLTKSELYNLIDSDNIIFPKLSKTLLIPGQGFSESEISDILSLGLISKNGRNFDFSLWHKIPKRASNTLTHKHNIENILISEPKRISSYEFDMDLLINENCEMMHDHQTGLHLQGMLLIEAARQAYLATMEKFYLQDQDHKNYFIFNALNIEYNKFSFPLPSTIRLTNEKTDFSSKKKQHTKSRIEILQCGQISASINMDVTIMPDKRVSNMENLFANKFLDEYINMATAISQKDLLQLERTHA